MTKWWAKIFEDFLVLVENLAVGNKENFKGREAGKTSVMLGCRKQTRTNFGKYYIYKYRKKCSCILFEVWFTCILGLHQTNRNQLGN